MNKINEILEERGSRYGEFKDFSEISQKLKDVMFLHINMEIGDEYKDINNVINEGIEMICHKLARIANGDPYYADNFDDIAGYASLVGSELEKFNKKQNKITLELRDEAYEEFVKKHDEWEQYNKEPKDSYKPKNWKEKCGDCRYCNHIVDNELDVDFYACGNENNIITNSEGLQEYQECEALWFLCNHKESVFK